MRRWIVGIAVAGSASWSVEAGAFCRTTTCNPAREACAIAPEGCVEDGLPLRHTRMPIVFRFRRGGLSTLIREEARAAVRAGFRRWSDVVCPSGLRTSLRFEEGEELEVDKPLDADARASESFGIFFRDTGWPHKDPDATYALTTLDSSKRTGVIRYADIQLNTAVHALSTGDQETGIDLQIVVTHEVGHYIGLAHSRAENAIMAEALCTGGDRCERGKVAARRLAADDLAAVCALYPPGARYDEDDAEGGCQVSHAPARDPLQLFITVVPAVVLGWRRWRRGRGP